MAQPIHDQSEPVGVSPGPCTSTVISLPRIDDGHVRKYAAGSEHEGACEDGEKQMTAVATT